MVTMPGISNRLENRYKPASFTEMAQWCNYNLPINSWYYESIGRYYFIDKVAYYTFMMRYGIQN